MFMRSKDWVKFWFEFSKLCADIMVQFIRFCFDVGLKLPLERNFETRSERRRRQWRQRPIS